MAQRILAWGIDDQEDLVLHLIDLGKKIFKVIDIIRQHLQIVLVGDDFIVAPGNFREQDLIALVQTGRDGCGNCTGTARCRHDLIMIAYPLVQYKIADQLQVFLIAGRRSRIRRPLGSGDLPFRFIDTIVGKHLSFFVIKTAGCGVDRFRIRLGCLYDRKDGVDIWLNVLILSDKFHL